MHELPGHKNTIMFVLSDEEAERLLREEPLYGYLISVSYGGVYCLTYDHDGRIIAEGTTIEAFRKTAAKLGITSNKK